MTRLAVLPILAAALWPAASDAQTGPSYNCAYASTATERAICANPDLSQLELAMFGAYQDLVARIGERRARQLADNLLERRQACGANEQCIAERLVTSMLTFDRRGRPEAELAAVEPPAAPPQPASPPEAEPPVFAPEIPLAAVAPWPLDSAPVPPVRPSGALPLTADDLDAAIAGAELASSDRAPAASETPISEAFRNLSNEERALIQSRLQAVGYYEGPADGEWNAATWASLAVYIAAEGDGFDTSTPSGAALALDYIGSAAFAQAHGLEPEAAEVPVTADPLAGAEW